MSVGAGTGISVSGTQVNVNALTTSEIATASLLLSTDTFSNSNTKLMTAAAVESRILSKNYTTNQGDITSITIAAGNGLTGTNLTATAGAFSGTLNVAAATNGGISVNADNIAVDSTVVRFQSNGYIYADNWIRIASGTGLYASTGHHFYINSTYGWNMRSSASSTSLLLQNSGGTQRGWFYADSGANQGFLTTGGAWALQVDNSKNVYAKGNLYATSSNHTVWHAGNDGSGSGLDADTLDGAQPSVSASNSTIVQRHSSGYIFSNYINTTDNGVSSGVTGIMVKQNNNDYHRTATAAAVRSFLNVADGATNTSAPNNGTITINQAGTQKGTFTVNQSGNTTINLTDSNTNTVTSIRQDNTGTYRTGNINLISGTGINVSESTAGSFKFDIASTVVTAGSGNVVFDLITADEINANHIAASSITARELAISNNSSGTQGIYFSTTAMEIRDATRVRVKIGAL